MRTFSILIALINIISFATQWQPPDQVTYTGYSPSFSYDNQKMYVTVVTGVPASDNIGYNTWNGSAWIWGGEVTGDIRNLTYSESESFITYDNQTMYFVRSNSAWTQIYKATRQGSSEVFNGSVPLGNQINYINGIQYANYPSLTHDQQNLYFVADGGGGYGKIYSAAWNGSDWDNVTLLPDEVNEGDASHPNRVHVCITPDGSELYFMLSSMGGGGYGRLGYSKLIGGVWQQWQYCDYNINGSSVNNSVRFIGITNGEFSQQKLYFYRYEPSYGISYVSLRSPITVQPKSLGSIKAIYVSK